MLRFLYILSILINLSLGDIADDNTIVSITKSAKSGVLQLASISDIIDVRDVPALWSGSSRRLSSTDAAVEACLANTLSVETMATIGVQVVKTAGEECNATRDDVCRYLEQAGEELDMVVLCEPNYTLKLEITASTAISGGVRSSLSGLGVNDKYSSKQWNLDLIGMKDAWKLIEERDLREVVVAVIDSGVDYRHEDLRENLFASDSCGYGYNFHDDNSDVSDVNGHGTHCAGILGAVTDNGVGVAGIARVKIMPLRVFGPDGTGDVRLALEALNYAVEQGADLSSHSYGSPDASSTFRLAISRAAEQGHLVVAAAGNEGRDISVDKVYPCAFTEQVDMICVASSGRTSDDQLASHSNYAPYVDIAAPGVEIPSTYPSNEYVYMTGTSMATPHVTGVAAILYSIGLSFDDIKKSIVESADGLNNRFNSEIGYFGRLNAEKAVEIGLTKPTIAPKEKRSVGGEECIPQSSAAVLPYSRVSLVFVIFLLLFV
ncbi:Suppressor of the cold-sensitive snRNP bioproteinsis mutant brr1-1 [Perkinsus chesapeaki]|uniref:subtilisin n=1 Tax=Perkinsus chesapeaki TaxID=330153 RepID=A0A7J6MLC4_PERCH|nr:Suppressor of the cold-sensitive snRNP bioproteinsis mutant brr1-1 [Perkinsus chesapeaki]